MDATDKPLGSITAHGAKYTLGADWKWTGPSEMVADDLNMRFNPQTVRCVSDAVAPRGYDIVMAAAKEFEDISPELPRFPDADRGPGEVVH